MTLQMTLGSINSPYAAEPKQPMHPDCMRKHMHEFLTTDEIKQAEEELLKLL